jgi:hypothetical protein
MHHILDKGINNMQWEAAIRIKDKFNDSLNPLDRERKASYKGDIIEVLPVGSDWGRLTVKEYLIIPLGELTEKQAKALRSRVEIEDNDNNGVPVIETVAKRKYRVNLQELDKKIKESGVQEDIENTEIECQPFKETFLPIERKELGNRKSQVLSMMESRKRYGNSN